MGPAAGDFQAVAVTPQLAANGAGMRAKLHGNLPVGLPGMMECRDLVALLQGQVAIPPVQLHLSMKRCRLRQHLTRFSSRKLHFAV